MKIYKISLSNAVIYSIISLVYISIFLYTGRVGLGKSISSSFPLVCFTVLGIIILIISSIVQMAVAPAAVAPGHPQFRPDPPHGPLRRGRGVHLPADP